MLRAAPHSAQDPVLLLLRLLENLTTRAVRIVDNALGFLCRVLSRLVGRQLRLDHGST
ncbi:MAG TPA: hypothetical protein VHT75_12680 [Acidimicrobiales bacterium]|nr:hypothetical protein [Acidimicrobiales bacterium]